MTLIKPIRLNVSEFHILSHDSIMWPSGSWSRNNTWPINTQHHSPHLPLSIIIIAFSQHWLSCQYCQTLKDNNIFFSIHTYGIIVICMYRCLYFQMVNLQAHNNGVGCSSWVLGCDRSAELCHNCYNSHNSSWRGPVTILSSRFIRPDCCGSVGLGIREI